MKIWDVLRDGKEGEVYCLLNTIPSWEHTEIQVKETELGSNVLVYASLPRIVNNQIGIGKTILLCGAVTDADWNFIETREPVSITLETELEEFIIKTQSLLKVLRKWNIGAINSPSLMIRKKAEWSSVAERILNSRMGHIHLLELIDEKEHYLLIRLKRELEMVTSDLYSLSIDELSEQLEFLIALIWYICEKTWKVFLSPYRYAENFPFNEEEMLLLLFERNVKYIS